MNKTFHNSLLSLALGTLLLSSTNELQAGGGFGGQGAITGTGAGSRTYTPSGEVAQDAVITYDPATNTITVISDDETFGYIQDVVSNVDVPRQQVLIKVVFMSVEHGDDLDFGVEAAYVNTNPLPNGDVETEAFGSMFGLEGALQAGGLANSGGAGFYQLLTDDLNVTVAALAQANETEVLARPSILARHAQEAVITIGKSVPFVTNSQITDNGNVINTVEYQDIGIILRVTPFISRDGLVEMIVAPEISDTTSETVQISDTTEAAVFSRTGAETVAVVPTGQTVIIGGLLQDRQTEIVRKIPLLGDIPLLGNLFSRTSKGNSKQELLIFLTPFIVDNPAGLGEVTHREAGSMQISKNAFDEETMNKYIDPSTRPQEKKTDYDLLEDAYMEFPEEE